jgi:hypothetical protein
MGGFINWLKSVNKLKLTFKYKKPVVVFAFGEENQVF